MPTWTVPDPPREQLVAHAQESLPRYWSKAPRTLEDLNAMAEVIAAGMVQADDWTRQTYITHAEGKWLRQHAKDRGIYPQEGESEDALRARLQSVDDAVTRPAIIAGVQAILDDHSVTGALAVVDLRRDRGFFGSYAIRFRSGLTFGTDDETGKLTVLPDTPFDTPIEVGFARSGSQANPRLYIQNWASQPALNDTHIEVVALRGDTLVLDNDGVAAEADPVASALLTKWKTGSAGDVKMDDEDPPNKRAYFGRGYRMGSRSSFIVILPTGTPDGVANSVRGWLATKKAFGIKAQVEVRS